MTETVETVIARAIRDQLTWPASTIVDMLVYPVIAALDAAGYALVPKEPTDSMLQAGRDADDVLEFFSSKRIYLAMLAAARAPSP